MALARRLYLTYQDDADTACLAEIWQEGYGGAATEMTMGSIPVVKRYGGVGWKNIIGSEATVSFYSSDDLSWLNTADGKDIKFIYYRAGVLDFSGYALPDQFSDPLGPYPREFIFVASDRLGVLSSIDYVDATPLPYETIESAIVIIAQALAKTGLTLNINCVCNLYEDSMSSGPTDDPIEQLDVRQDIIVDDDLNPGSCAAILDVILQTFQLRLVQSAGEWWLWRVPETENDPLSYRIFDSAGAYSSAGEFASGSQLKTTNSTTFIMLADCSIEGVAPYRDVAITSYYDPRESVFRGWKFPENEFITTTTFRHFTVGVASGWTQFQVGDNYMISCDQIAAFDATKYIRTETIQVKTGTAQWKLTIPCGCTNNGTLIVRIVLWAAGPTGYSVQQDGTWLQSALAQDIVFPVPLKDIGEVDSVEFLCDAIPADGDLYIDIYTPYYGAATTFYVDEIKFFPISAIGIPWKETDTSKITINSNNNVSLGYSINLTDTPLYNTELFVYRGLAQVGGVLTEAWQLDGAGTSRTLVEWLQQWVDATTGSFRFQGGILGSSNYFNPIKLTEFNDEVFLWEAVSYNTKTRIWSGSAMQLKGVLLAGATTAVSPRTGGSASGGGGGIVAPVTPFTGYRAAVSVALASGDNTVSFSSPFAGGSSYTLRVLALTTAGGYETRGVITNKTISGFDINVDEACTMEYDAMITL